jgi:hypothetical protein
MFLKKILPGLALVAALLTSVTAHAEEKSTTPPRCAVMAYNVENLFDLDAISLYDDFPVTGTGPERWTPEKLAGKLSRLAAVLKTSGNGRGPDVVILDELEAVCIELASKQTGPRGQCQQGRGHAGRCLKADVVGNNTHV